MASPAAGTTTPTTTESPPSGTVAALLMPAPRNVVVMLMLAPRTGGNSTELLVAAPMKMQAGQGVLKCLERLLGVRCILFMPVKNIPYALQFLVCLLSNHLHLRLQGFNPLFQAGPLDLLTLDLVCGITQECMQISIHLKKQDVLLAEFLGVLFEFLVALLEFLVALLELLTLCIEDDLEILYTWPVNTKYCANHSRGDNVP